MTVIDRTPFDDFYEAFGRKVGEDLVLEVDEDACDKLGLGVTGTVYVTMVKRGRRNPQMRLYSGDGRPEDMPLIKLKKHGVYYLETSVRGMKITARDWATLARKVEEHNSAEFPECAQSVMLQASGDPRYKGAYHAEKT